MDNLKPGDTVEFHGLTGAAHLNGTKGYLVEFLTKEQQWAVRCDDEDDEMGKIVNAKPANLKRVGAKPSPEKELYVHPMTSQCTIPKKISTPVTDPSFVIDNVKSLHEAALDAF